MPETPGLAPLLRYTIPTTCRERFLPEGVVASRALNASQLASGGLSDLQAAYDILRTPFAHDHAILFTLSGEGLASSGNLAWRLVPGSVLLLPATCEHHYWAERRWSMLWFHPRRTPHWDRLFCAPILREAQWTEDLRILAELFLAERRRSRPESRWILESLAKTMALFLEREAGNAGGGPERGRGLEALWKAVAERPDQDWSLGACASLCGMAPRTLQLAVKRLHDEGVTEIVGRIRMEQARSLLEHTDWKLEDIAGRVGYRNAFAFSRAFKRAVGLSPAAYRAACRGARSAGIPK